uniref:Peptidase M48 domain-containing protein n=1 Tax=Meloidogyne javanica TaxID=6303 RepID=A0A915LGI6_MELJA
MPKAKSARQLAAIRREAERRTKNADAQLIKDVEWIIDNWYLKITTENRSTICRDFRNMLNRQVLHTYGICEDDMKLIFVFDEENEWDDAKSCGYYLAYKGLKDSIHIRLKHALIGHKLFAILAHELAHRTARRILLINDDSDWPCGHGPRFQEIRDRLHLRFDTPLYSRIKKLFPFQ